MEFVGKGLGEGIVEDRDGFTEGDAVLLRLAAALAGSNSKVRWGTFTRWMSLPF